MAFIPSIITKERCGGGSKDWSAFTIIKKCFGILITLVAITDRVRSKLKLHKSKLRESFFVLKKFTLEAIVQVARSLGTKSLGTNQNFSPRNLSVAPINTDLKPLNNYLQCINHIKPQFCGVITYKAF
jgi:hypothetical protein